MSDRARSATIDKLRERLACLEPRRTLASGGQRSIQPWRDLVQGALHEITSNDWRDATAASFYALTLAGHLAQARLGSVIVLGLKYDAGEGGLYYAADRNFCGIDTSRLVLCYAENIKALLWAAEEAAHSSSVAALVIETRKPHRLLSLAATRRLQLAAEKSGSTPILLRSSKGCEPSAAMRRFHVSSRPSAPASYNASAPGRFCWRVEIERCRLGNNGGWLVEWDDEKKELKEAPALSVSVPAALAYRPAHRREAFSGPFKTACSL